MNNISPKKPSTAFNASPRTSPFKRSDSSAARTPSGSTVRASTTPTASPYKQQGSSSPRWQPNSPTPSTNSATFSLRGAGATSTNATPSTRAPGSGDALTKLNAAQVHEMRESFQVLDRDDDGQLTREDVVEVLNQLGLDSSAASLNPYFPPSQPPSLNLATYLSTFASLLSPMSRPDDLAAAFAAFDLDDSGQIDLEELRDALLHTPPEQGGKPLSSAEIDSVVDGFTARRTFGKGAMGMPGGKGRAEVFRYLDFMGTLNGKPAADATSPPEAAPV